MSAVPRFVLFGAAHVAVLAATAAVAGALAVLVRRRPVARRPVRAVLLAVLAAATALYFAGVASAGRLSWWDLAPLHLCDFLILVAAFALVTLQRDACEILYFWALSGTLLAMVTPDLVEGWPDWRFLAYFAAHGAVVVSAIVVTFGLGRRPRPAAPARVFLLTNAYAAVVGVVDAVSGMNFLYLREKPWVPTLLDRFGPWPLYLLVVEAIALGLFVLLGEAGRARGPRARDGAA